MRNNFFLWNTLLPFATILFAIKGLGGSFNALFTGIGIPQFHGPFVGGILGILIVTYLSHVALNQETKGNTANPTTQLRRSTVILFVLLLAVGTWIRISKIHSIPIDEGRADMLVTISSQIKDFTQGKDPYIPYVTGQGRELQRFYLPMLWLSYTPFYLAGLDIRYFNILAQDLILILLLYCFLIRNTYGGLSPKVSNILFLGSIALFCFSKQKIADVLDVQTAAFSLFYCLVLWAELNGKTRLTDLLVPVVLVCRHPAILLFLPLFLFLFLNDSKRFWKLVGLTLVISSLLIFPFMKNPYNIIESILFYGGGIKDANLEVTSMFFGLSSVLQRTGLTVFQKPLQISGLTFALWAVFQKRSQTTVGTLALGGIAYTTFILLVSSTPQYIWAEPLLLIYFLVNGPGPDRINKYA